MAVPANVTSYEWAAALNAAGRFLDQWGGKAHGLGWSAAELFGLDPAAPLYRRDRLGAAFFLAHREVIAITADDLTVRAGIAIQRIPRRSAPVVPAWEALP
jgi:hypothetical protein